MKAVEPIRDKKMIGQMLSYAKKQSDRDFMMLMLGLYTGLRITDILSLKVRDVKGKNKIYIKEKKTKKTRQFTINKDLRSYLKEYCRGKEGYEYLIQSRQGINRPISRQRAYQIVKEIGETFNLDDIACHSLRKSFGYHHYNQYKNIVLLQTILNHSRPEITLRYIGIEQQQIDESIDGLSFF
jgi:integrase